MTSPNPVKKPLGLSHGPTQISAVNPNAAERFRTNGVYYLDDNLCTIGTFVANNWGYVDVPCGAYTYRQFGISIVAAANIATVTTPRDGKEYVNSAKIADYIDTIIIEINGQNKWEMTAAELLKWNAYNNLDTTDGVLRIAFGSPMGHDADVARDAYQFGTAGLRSVKLRIKTKPAWVTGMLPVISTEYAPVARPIGYFQTTTRYVYTNPGTGLFGITDLAVGLDFSGIWVQGNNVNRVKLTIDRQEVADLGTYLLRSMHEAWGKDVLSLGNGAIFDTFRDGQAIGIDSVSNSVAERNRGADVRLDLDMGAASQTLTVTVFHCGLYSDQ